VTTEAIDIHLDSSVALYMCSPGESRPFNCYLLRSIRSGPQLAVLRPSCAIGRRSSQYFRPRSRPAPADAHHKPPSGDIFLSSDCSDGVALARLAYIVAKILDGHNHESKCRLPRRQPPWVVTPINSGPTLGSSTTSRRLPDVSRVTFMCHIH
jgi:hypothetical protein